MSNVKNFKAVTAIGAFLLVAHASADGEVRLATAPTDLLVGVSEDISHASGERIDVVRHGVERVTYGGTVTRGAPLTAAANGRAVVAAPAAGSNVRIIGYAEVAGIDGDIVEMLINVQTLQG